jgi:glycerol-3-phosphate O-acyltransferase
LTRDESDFSDAIDQLVRMDLIRSSADARGEILYFEPGKRRALDIYRNMILHYLATPSFLARELLAGGTREEVVRRLDTWLDLMHGEFFTARDDTQREHVAAFLHHFAERDWILEEGGVLRATPEGESHLGFLAGQMRAVIESYYVAFSAVARIEEPIGPKALRKVISEQFERAALLGEAGLPEAQNSVTFGNAIDALTKRGVLALTGGEKGDGRDPPVDRGPRWKELETLREWLAAAVGGR